MLLQFSYKNFKSFRDQAVLDMRASSISELANHVRVSGNDNVLTLAAIYGANASGKSNLYSAFEFMANYVKYSYFIDMVDNRVLPILKNMLTQKPFLFSEKPKDKSEFDIYFTVEENSKVKYYNYGFALDKKGVVEEWLTTNTKTGVVRGTDYKVIFNRRRNKPLELEEALIEYKENLNISMRERTLLITLGSVLDIKVCKDIMKWFENIKPIDCSKYFHEEMSSTDFAKEIYKDEDVKKQVLKYLRAFDVSISDIKVEKTETTNSSKDDSSYSVFTIHRVANDGIEVILPLNEESSGTIKMYHLYAKINEVLKKGSILFSDEIDIKLHPLLMRNIIITFTDPVKNPKGAQLIFTTHNTIYMEMDLLRRDEIWFVEKNSQVSELYSLDDITDSKGNKVRKDNNYQKNYLLGRYGAVPFLSSIFGGEDDEEI